MVASPGAGDQVLAELLARPRYEVIPLDGTEEAMLAHVPTEVKVTVTTSPRKGLEPTLQLAEKVAGHGYAVVPHLAARHVRDPGHLAELVERLRAFGVSDVLVMAGDAEEPAGEFDGSLPLLRALAELGQPFRDVGITGYPESHAFISDDATIKSMFAKEEFATYIVSQICFDPQVTAAWVAAVWERGTKLPIHIGLPGPVPLTKLIRVSARIGVGDSLRFLRTHKGWLGRAFSGAFDPTPLVEGLDENLADARPNLAGFHVFTFNELEGTERWRRRHLEELGATRQTGSDSASETASSSVRSRPSA
jgi:methylenetetrahydrofolate reductase (NADPH)